MNPRYSQTYAFHTLSDDGVRLWVNGQLLIDNWTYHAPTENRGSIYLEAGRKYDIKLEFFEGGGGPVMRLLWWSPSQPREIVLSSQVLPAGRYEGYTPNPLNQYHTVGGQPLSYDAKFNLTGYSGAAQVYNAANQLTAASKGGESVQMVYDGLGRCVKRTTNGVARVFSYDGWQPILEWDEAGNRFAYNIYGAGWTKSCCATRSRSAICVTTRTGKAACSSCSTATGPGWSVTATMRLASRR